MTAIERQTLTPAHLAERWHTSTSTLANQRSKGTGPQYLKIGAKVLYVIEDVLAYEARHRVATIPA